MLKRLRILMFAALALTVACAPAEETEARAEVALERSAAESGSVDACGREAVELVLERFSTAPGTVFVVVTTTAWARWLSGTWSQSIVPAC